MNKLWQYIQNESSDTFSLIKERIAENPGMALKAAAAIAVLVISYVIVIPIYRKADYFLSRERKRDIAKSRGHVIDAKRVKYSSGDDDSHATYEYTIGNQKKQYRALFQNRTLPPIILQLYWIDNPNRVFAVDDYHYEVFSRGLPLLFLTFLPWLLAAGVLSLLM